MASRCSLPYLAAPSILPQPLPSIEEIARLGEVKSESFRNVQSESPRRRIVRLGPFTIKYGTNVCLLEGENMLFVKEHTSMPVPTVYALFSEEGSCRSVMNYIIMETIPGDTLLSLWDNLSEEKKSAIAAQLRANFDELRNIPSQGYFGSLRQRPLKDSMFWATDVDDISCGPFKTEAELVETFVKKYRCNAGPRMDHKAEYYRRVLPHVLRGEPTFTHGDVQRKNLMLQPDGTVVVLDWESAGWYPRYWESAMAMFCCGRWDDDWHVWLAKFLDEYPNEYAWLLMIQKELWS